MGLDGLNTLTIIGPEESIAALKENALCFPLTEEDPPSFRVLQQEYFGHTNISIVCRETKFLKINYAFRNCVPVEYLKRLILYFPNIWLKNEYYIEDDGQCGVWIAQMRDQTLEVQEARWSELSTEEFQHFD